MAERIPSEKRKNYMNILTMLVKRKEFFCGEFLVNLKTHIFE